MKLYKQLILVLFACASLFSCTMEIETDKDITSMQTFFSEVSASQWHQEHDRWFWAEIRVNELTSTIAERGSVLVYNHPDKSAENADVWQKLSYSVPNASKNVAAIFYSFKPGVVRIDAMTTAGTFNIDDFDGSEYKIVLLNEKK